MKPPRQHNGMWGAARGTGLSAQRAVQPRAAGSHLAADALRTTGIQRRAPPRPLPGRVPIRRRAERGERGLTDAREARAGAGLGAARRGARRSGAPPHHARARRGPRRPRARRPRRAGSRAPSRRRPAGREPHVPREGPRAVVAAAADDGARGVRARRGAVEPGDGCPAGLGAARRGGARAAGPRQQRRRRPALKTSAAPACTRRVPPPPPLSPDAQRTRPRSARAPVGEALVEAVAVVDVVDVAARDPEVLGRGACRRALVSPTSPTGQRSPFRRARASGRVCCGGGGGVLPTRSLGV